MIIRGKDKLYKNKKKYRKFDIVVVKFGEKYKQWNAAFDAGYSAAKVNR